MRKTLIGMLTVVALAGCAKAGEDLECITPGDCPTNASCVNNRCLRENESRPDTATDAEADTAVDVEVDTAVDVEADTVPDTAPDTTPPDTDLPDTASGDTENDAATDTDAASDTEVADTDVAPACGLFDVSCTRGTDCCSGLCVPTALGATTGFCTENCSEYGDCNPAGRRGDFACLPVDDAGATRRVCLPSDFDGRCDASSDCLGGICLRTASASSCSWECQSAADCPDGTACGLMDFGGGDLRYACAPVGNPCLSQDNCLSQTCITPDTGSLGYCSLFCRSSRTDCPSGWRCSAVDPTQPDLFVCELP